MLLSIPVALDGLTSLSDVLSTALTDAVLQNTNQPLELRQLLSLTARIKRLFETERKQFLEENYGNECGREAVKVKHVVGVITAAVKVHEDVIVKLESGGGPETLVGLVRDMEAVERGLEMIMSAK